MSDDHSERGVEDAVAIARRLLLALASDRYAPEQILLG